MSSEFDGEGRSDNIDEIRQLLRKLEEVALRAGDQDDDQAGNATAGGMPGTGGWPASVDGAVPFDSLSARAGAPDSDFDLNGEGEAAAANLSIDGRGEHNLTGMISASDLVARLNAPAAVAPPTEAYSIEPHSIGADSAQADQAVFTHASSTLAESGEAASSALSPIETVPLVFSVADAGSGSASFEDGEAAIQLVAEAREPGEAFELRIAAGEQGSLGEVPSLETPSSIVVDAARDGGARTSAPSEDPRSLAVSRSQGLSALQRGTSLARADEMIPELVARPLAIQVMPAAQLPDTVAVPAQVRRGRGRGIAIAIGSFAFGAVAAGVMITAFAPLKQYLDNWQVAHRAPQEILRVAETTSAANADPEASTTAAAAATTAVVPATGNAMSGATVDAPPVAQPSQIVADARVGEGERQSFSAGNVSGGQSGAQAAAAAAAGAVAGGAAPAAGAPIDPAVKAVVAAAAAQSGLFELNVPARVEVRGGERKAVDVRVEPMPSEAARLLVVFRNLPEWLSLSKGGAIGNQIWLLPAHQASDVAIEVTDGTRGTANVKVQLASVDGRIYAEQTISVRASGQLMTPPAMTAEAAPSVEPTPARLQARGELLLDTGEVEAARTLFRTAAEAGSVAAALRLAETYDPAEVVRLGVNDGAADPVQAVRWYERARALGSPVAAARLAALGQR